MAFTAARHINKRVRLSLKANAPPLTGSERQVSPSAFLAQLGELGFVRDNSEDTM